MRVKRGVRYLAHRHSVLCHFEVKELTECIDVYTDSDWAGEPTSRRSTSGGALCYEGCAIKTSAKLQGMVVLSSAEAEYLAMFKGVQEALALRTMLLEMGMGPASLFSPTVRQPKRVEKPG